MTESQYFTASERGDRHAHPAESTYRFLTLAECKALHGHASITDRAGRIARVSITSVKTWKTRPMDCEVHCKFGLYEYFTVRMDADHPNSELCALVQEGGTL